MITPFLEQTRNECVAPCAVVFDATRTTATTTERPFHELDYSWNFGDDPLARWTTDNKSKNTAKGAVAAHIYERAGTYMAELDVKDMLGNSARAQATVIVRDPEEVFSGKTACISTSGDFTGCPGGAERRISSDFTAQMNLLFVPGGPQRVLFRRGESFRSTATVYGDASPGPFVIGAFGTGEKPVVTFPSGIASEYAALILWRSTPDTIVMDLNFSGPNTLPFSAFYGGIWVAPRSTIFRCDFSGLDHPVSSSGVASNATVIAENNLAGNTRYGSYFHYGENAAFLGNNFDGANSHLMRPYIRRSVVQHNKFKNAGYLYIKAVGMEEANPAKYNIYSDNIFLGSNKHYKVAFGAQSMRVLGFFALGPQDGATAEYTEDIIIERNRWELDTGYTIFDGSYYNSPLGIHGAKRVTVRNNVFVGPGTAITLGEHFVPTSEIWIYNNLFYSQHAVSGPLRFVYGDAVPNTIIRNNIIVAPFGNGESAGIELYATATGQLSSGDNIWYLPRSLNPFKLQGDSYSNLSTFQSAGQETGSLVWNGTSPLLSGNFPAFCRDMKLSSKVISGAAHANQGGRTTLTKAGADFENLAVFPDYRVKIINGTSLYCDEGGWICNYLAIESVTGDTLTLVPQRTYSVTPASDVQFEVWYSPSTADRIYLSDNAGFAVGDLVEYNGEELPYYVSAVGADAVGEYILLDKPLPARPRAPNSICNWGANPLSLRRDYHLSSQSIALDSGAPAPVFDDFDGAARPFDLTNWGGGADEWDIGPFEYAR